MSEVQQRPPPPPRGRGSSRGGRGGSSFGTRGGGQIRGTTRNSNGDINASYSSIEDQGELGQLKKQYATQLNGLKEMFPDWSLEDLAPVVQDNGGDLDAAAAKITDGPCSQSRSFSFFLSAHYPSLLGQPTNPVVSLCVAIKLNAICISFRFGYSVG